MNRINEATGYIEKSLRLHPHPEIDPLSKAWWAEVTKLAAFHAKKYGSSRWYFDEPNFTSTVDHVDVWLILDD